jgi:hypothetical protein
MEHCHLTRMLSPMISVEARSREKRTGVNRSHNQSHVHSERLQMQHTRATILVEFFRFEMLSWRDAQEGMGCSRQGRFTDS